MMVKKKMLTGNSHTKNATMITYTTLIARLLTSVLHFGSTSFCPLNKLKFRAESNYDTAHARRRKEMGDIFCVMLF